MIAHPQRTHPPLAHPPKNHQQSLARPQENHLQLLASQIGTSRCPRNGPSHEQKTYVLQRRQMLPIACDDELLALLTVIGMGEWTDGSDIDRTLLCDELKTGR